MECRSTYLFHRVKVKFHHGSQRLILSTLMAETSIARIDLLIDSDEEDCHSERRAKVRKNSIVLSIEHCTTTAVSDVGLQVWKGAFLLSDYLISIRDELSMYLIVELGAGCGLTSSVLALIRHRGCYVTDFRDDILDLALHNLHRNQHLIHSSPFGCSELSPMFVRKLDWFEATSGVEFQQDSGGYQWSEEDNSQLKDSKRVFIAADVIYDDILTEALFLKLSHLMKENEKLILTLEKRFNYTLANQAITATGYELFLYLVNASETATLSSPQVSKYIKKFQGQKIDISKVQQRLLGYERCPNLELWEIICIE